MQPPCYPSPRMQRGGKHTRELVVLAALLLATLWLLWPGGEAPQPEPADEAHTQPAPAAAEPPPAEPAVAQSERTDLTQPQLEPAPEPDLAHPFAYTLDLHLVDAFGLPVPGGMVFAAPRLCGLSLWPAMTDARGRVELHWRGRARSMQLQLAVLVWGVLQPMRLVDLDEGSTRKLSIVVRGREQSEETLQRLQARRPEDERLDAYKVRRGRLRRNDDFDALCGRTLLLFKDYSCIDCHEPSRVASYSTLSRCAVIAPGLHPFATFPDLRLGALSESQREERQRMLQQSEAGPEKKVGRAPRLRAHVSGQVLAADGEPAAQVPVAWLDASGAVRRRTLTDDKGTYSLGPIDTGLLTLRAGGGDGGDVQDIVLVTEGDPTPWNCRLVVDSALRGSACDETGGVLVDWRVECEGMDGDWADLALTRKDGTFIMPSVPGACMAMLWPSDKDLALPVLFGKAVLPGINFLPLRLDPMQPTRARLRLHPFAPDNAKGVPVDARICQLDSGRIAQLVSLGHEEAFELQGLCAGPYRVEVGAPLYGWVDAGVAQLDGRGLWDIGAVQLPRPGRAQLHLIENATSPLLHEHACYRRTEAMDVQENFKLDDEGALLLPPGEHLLLWREQETVRAMQFAVHAAQTTAVVIAPR